MDRRQQKTRDAIFAAFNGLLSEKRYSQITVQEIIDRANVGRSTFYAHFETKDELLRATCVDLFDHVVSDHLSKELTHDFSKSGGGADSTITHILYHLRDNRKTIACLFTSDSGELFMRYFKEYLTDVFRDKLGSEIFANREVPADFLLNHISCTFVETVNWWIRHDMTETPEEIERCFLAVIRPVLESDRTQEVMQ